MDNYKTPIYDLSLSDLKRDGGYYDVNGLWNAVFITDDNLILRDRVETFIFKIEDNVLYVYIKMNTDGTYRIPGGSKTKGVTDKAQAYLECREEARIVVSDMEYTGVDYIKWYPDKVEEIKEKPIAISDNNVNAIKLNQVDWVGTHNSVYIGFYESQYHGIVERIDKDEDMYKNGRFYPVASVSKYINENHKPVFDKIIEYYKNSGDDIVVEASSLDADTQAMDMITDIDISYNKMDNYLFTINPIEGLKYNYNKNEDGTYGICCYKFTDENGYYQLRDFLSELNKQYIEKESPLMFLIPSIDTKSGIIVAAKPGLVKESEQIENPDSDMKVVDNHAKTSRFSPSEKQTPDWSEEVHKAYSNYQKDKSPENKDALLQLGFNPDEGSPENAEEIIAQAESAAITEGVISINEKFILSENEISNEACLDESGNEIVDEAYIIDKKDAAYNVNKWSTDSDHNILYITGLSGSGKSTFARDIAKQEKAQLVELDLFQNYDRNKKIKYTDFTMKLIDEYMKKYPEMKDKDFSDITSESFGEYFVPFFNWLRERLAKENKKFVVEGIHILLFIPYSDIEGEPLVCIGTSMTKSLIRHWKRDKWNITDMVKYGKLDISQFNDWEKQYKDFKSGINETVLCEKMSGDDYANESYIEEKYIANEPDIYYNKDKFDSGEINLCFITGHSGSGKSTMAHGAENKNIEAYELDDVLANKLHFSMNNLKEYGDLIYSFFKGPGKKYYYDETDIKNGTIKEYKGDYDRDLIMDFIDYSINYSKSHKNKKYIIEGIWLYKFIPPAKLKDYTVYIKGTSKLISDLRAAKRDSKEDFPDKKDILKRSRVYLGRAKNFFTKETIISENDIKRYREYFGSKSVKESKLSSDDRKDLPDSVFGLPKKRKYPMPDKKHVFSAIKFFNFVDEEDEKELAKNIKKMMKKYDIDDSHVGKDNRLRKYLTEQTVMESKLFRNMKLYHGSSNLYDTLQPYGVDFGNAFQEPGWSLFCWKNKDSAFGWAIFDLLKNMKQYYPIETLGCLNSDTSVITQETYDFLKENLKEIPRDRKTYYVYELTPPEDAILGLGHSSNTKGCVTIRNKDIRYNKVDKCVLTINDIDKYCVIGDKEHEPSAKEMGLNSRFSTFLMTRDFMYNHGIRKTIQQGVNSGELQYGDSIDTYLKNKGIELKSVSVIDRIKK